MIKPVYDVDGRRCEKGVVRTPELTDVCLYVHGQLEGIFKDIDSLMDIVRRGAAMGEWDVSDCYYTARQVQA